MKQFVLLFRQGPKDLSETELKQRGDEVRAWAIRQRGEGRILDARILDDQACRAGRRSSAVGTRMAGERSRLSWLE